MSDRQAHHHWVTLDPQFNSNPEASFSSMIQIFMITNSKSHLTSKASPSSLEWCEVILLLEWNTPAECSFGLNSDLIPSSYLNSKLLTMLQYLQYVNMTNEETKILTQSPSIPPQCLLSNMAGGTQCKSNLYWIFCESGISYFFGTYKFSVPWTWGKRSNGPRGEQGPAEVGQGAQKTQREF
jgi:hypothetical protein